MLDTNQNASRSGGTDTAIALDSDAFEDRVEATWFQPTIPRQTLKALMKRSDAELMQ